LRRPVAFLCGAYVIGMAAEIFLKLNYFIFFIVAVCMAGAMLICLHFYKNNRLRWEKKHLCLFFIAFLLSLAGAIQYHHYVNKINILEGYQGEYVSICGVVKSAAEKDDENHKLTVLVHGIKETGSLPKKEKILINIYGSYPDCYKLQGRSIEVKGFIEFPSGRRNPKTFDYKTYLKTKNISVIMSVVPGNIQASERIDSPYLNGIAQIKNDFKGNVYGFFDDEVAALLMGMMFGDSSGLEEEVYDSFQKNGICHILAVSGLHIGVLYSCINGLLGGKRKIKFYIIIVIVLFFYVSLANFAASVMRAFFMIMLHIFSKYMYCKYDMFTSSAVTMSVMVFFNPMSLLSLGFQLSFLAIFSLAVLLPAAERIWNKSIASVLAVQAGMAPISAFAFNYLSLSAFIANIPVIFISGILIPLGILLLLFSVLSVIGNEFGGGLCLVNASFQITGIAAEFVSKLLLFINDLVFIEKVSYQYVTSPPLWGILLYYSILFFSSTEIFRIMWQRKQYKLIGQLIAVVISVSLIFGNSLKDGFEQVQLTFVDVGQGDCLLIKTAEGKNILIDSGGSSRYDVGKKLLLPYLLKNGVKEIDMAIVTHLHTDHVGGLCSLSREIAVKKVGVYEGNQAIEAQVKERIGVAAEDFVYLAAGQRLEFGKDLIIEVLYPNKKSEQEYEVIMKNQEDENEACLVMRIIFNGVSVIMTGDIDSKAEQAIVEEHLSSAMKADILKIAHHGSKYGSSQLFLSAVQPRIAIVQVGKNTYGHPNKETLNRIKQEGAYIYRNDTQGAVGVEINNQGKIKIHTMI